MAGIDIDAVRRATGIRHAVISTNDERIPDSLTYPLATALDATVHEVDDAGHFLDDDGVTSIPVLQELAASIVKGGAVTARLPRRAAANAPHHGSEAANASQFTAYEPADRLVISGWS